MRMRAGSGRMREASRPIGIAALGLRILFLGACSLCLTACPPQPPPCEDPVENVAAVESAITANPVVQQVADVLTIRSIESGTCFVEGRVLVMVQVELPKTYSEFDIVYTERLDFSYARDGAIDITGHSSRPAALDAAIILEFYRERVARFESFPRVREVILKTEPDPQYPVVSLGSVDRLNNKLGYAIQDADAYNEAIDYVASYSLSHDIDWQEFPEIARAHDLVETHLLVDEYASCTIGRGSVLFRTHVQFHTSPTDPWWIAVSVVCEEEWKTAFVQIMPDGSYDRLSISPP